MMLMAPAQSWSLPFPGKRLPPLLPKQPRSRQLLALAPGKASGVGDSPGNVSRAQQVGTLRRRADVEQPKADSKSPVFNHQDLRLWLFCGNQVTKNTFGRSRCSPDGLCVAPVACLPDAVGVG